MVHLKREQVEILVEESSMNNLLRVILPMILPEGYQLDANCFSRVYEGKADLKKQIPSKIRAYQHYSIPIKVIIIQDQDSRDCKELKKELQSLFNGFSLLFLIRIACQELEAWYFGDLDAVEKLYPAFKADNYKRISKYRIPDAISHPAKELKRLIPEFQKGLTSREIPRFMSLDKNTSTSFNHLITGIQRLLSN